MNESEFLSENPEFHRIVTLNPHPVLVFFSRVTLDRSFHSQDLLQANKSEPSVMEHKHWYLILKSPLTDSNAPAEQRTLLVYSVQATAFLLPKPGCKACNHCELLNKCNTC